MKFILLKYYLSIPILSLLTVCNSFSQSSETYTFKVLAEKEFNDSSFFESQYILTDNQFENFFTISSLPSPFGWGVYVPEIIYVDQNQNYYLTDRTNKMIIYDNSNSLIKEIVFPETFQFNALYLTSNNELVYELLNQQQIKFFSLNDSTSSLSEINFESKNESSKIYGLNGKISNDLLISHIQETKDIFASPTGRFLKPQKISLFTSRDDRFNSKSGRIPEIYFDGIKDKNIKLEIYVEEYSDRKFVYVRDSYLDSNGNLYLTGIHSNTVERLNEFEIKVLNSSFFIWKFEKN
ncbi:MAG TPA: hypothetical protein VK004_06590 [Ignavibacteria bacterium]|nr:hypothetical protein [Ignavibacteria bacterium]